VLGICAGMQLLVEAAGGRVGAAAQPELGFDRIDVVDDSDLLSGLPAQATVFQSHTDEVISLPPGIRVLASSPRSAIQAVAAEEQGFWGTQFHPELSTSEHPAGLKVLRNFFELARG
jgi:GMP synthase (glutamine-hydrolysing)